MRILLLTAGSRGDVEPFAALASRARAEGHDVRLVAPDGSGVDTDGIDVTSLGVDYTRLIEAQGVSAAGALRSYREVVRPLMRQVLLGGAQAVLDHRPDVVAYHPKLLSAPLAADALGVPHVLVELVPTLTPTRRFAAAGTSQRGLGPLNRATYRMGAAAAAMFRSELDEVRRALGTRTRTPSPPAATLLPISPAVLARPDDWPATAHLTGPWHRDGAPAVLDPEVAELVARGPFLYAGFGSMAAGDAAHRGRAVVDAARTTGLPVLVATGTGGIEVPADRRGPDVVVTRAVPHATVLPHAVAAVHHGGIGTVQAAIRAGTPSVVVPFVADQPFWAARLAEAGLAPAPLRRGSLTGPGLARALRAAEACRPRVAEAARAMSTEDGARAALAVLAGLV